MSKKTLMLYVLGLLSLGTGLLATTDAVMMRLYGDRYDSQVSQTVSFGTASQLDTSFGTNGGKSLASQLGSGVNIKAMAISPTDGWLYVAADNGSTDVRLAKFDADGVLDSSFASSGVATIAQKNVKDICIDSNGYLLLCGGDGSAAGWLTRYTSAGIVDPLFTVGDVATVGSTVVLHKVAEQKSGRIIVGASDGRVYAFRSTGVADTTFNPNETSLNYYTVSSGNAISGLIVDSSDNIFTAYLATTIQFAKLKADGSSLVSSFGTSGVFNTSVTPQSASQFRLTQDNDGKFILAYVDANSGLFVRRYATTGTDLDTTFDTDGIQSITTLGTNGKYTNTTTRGSYAPGQLYYDFSTFQVKKVSDNTVVASVNIHPVEISNVYTVASSLPPAPSFYGDYRKVSITLADIAVDEDDQIVAVVYDNNSTVVTTTVRFNSDGSFDTAFSSDGILSDTSNSLTAVYAVGVHPDGAIFIAGTASSSSKLVRIFGDVYDGQYVQAQTVGAPGTVDTTFETTGQWDVATALSLTGYYLRKMAIDNNGYMILAFDNGTNTKIVKLKPDRTLDTSFGDASSGITTLSSIAAVSDLLISQAGDIYVGGGTTTQWVRKISSSGVNDSSFASAFEALTLDNAAKVLLQSNGRILVLGTDGSDGKVYGYKPTGEFESNIFATFALTDANSNATNGLYDGVVDRYDRLYVINKNATTGKMEVQRYTEYGVLDTTFGTAGYLATISAASSTATMKIAIDNTNNQIVIACVNGSGAIVVRCYDLSGNLIDAERTISSVGTLSALCIDDARNVYVVGVNGSSNVVVARLIATDSTFAFDSAFGVSGLLTTGSFTGITTVTDALIHPDRRILISGYSGSTTAYLGRVFGDDYALRLSEAIALGTAGAQDTRTIATTNVIDYASSVAYGQFKTVSVLDDGYLLATIDTGSATKLVQLVKGSFALETAWQTDGIADTNAPTGVQDLIIDQGGNFLIAGTTGGASWLKRYLADGDVDETFGTSGTAASHLTAGYFVREQSSGRILLGGLNGSNGALMAFDCHGVLDTTFGTNGIYTLGSNALYDGVIDAQDRIVVACKNGSNVDLVAIRPNGLGLDTTFGTSGSVSSIFSNITYADQIRIIRDSNNKYLIAATISTGIYLVRYTSTGALDTTFNTDGTALQVTANTNMRITDLDINTQGIIVVSGYDSGALDNRSFVARVAENGSSVLSTVSYEISSANNTGQINAAAIYLDGRVVAVGYENDGINNHPKLTRVYSNPFIPEYSQQIAAGNVGDLDIVFAGSGLKDVQLSAATRNQYGRSVVTLLDNHVVVGSYGKTQADNTYNHFIISRFGTDGVLDSSFGSSGIYASPGYVDAENSITAHSEYLYAVGLDHNENVIAVGFRDNGSHSHGLIKRIAADGSGADTSFNVDGPTPGTVAQDAAQLYALAFQSSGRIIAVGKDTNNNKGLILACRADGVLDTTFGVNGKAYIDDAQELHSVIIDADDNIFVSYKSISSGNANVACMQSNGFGLLSTYGSSGKALAVLTGPSAHDRVHLAFDVDGKIVVAASVTASNAVKVRRLLTTGAVDTSFNTDGSALTVTSGANTTIVQKVMVNSANNIILAGYVDVAATTQDRLFFASINSNGTLNSSFGVSGVSLISTTIGDAYQEIHDAVILPEGKIFAVGSILANGDAVYNTYLASIYADRYSSQISRSPAFIRDAGLDETFGTAGVFASFGHGNYARAVQALSTGKSVVALDNGTTGQWVARVTSTGVIDTSYGSSGYCVVPTTGSTTETIADMIVDGRGRVLLVGTSAEQGGFIKRLTTSGAMDTTFDTDGLVYDSDFASIHCVVEISTGVIIVGGVSAAGTGLLKAYYTADGSVVTDGAALGGFATNGVYTDTTTGASGVYSLVADVQDNIYAAIGYTSSGTKKLRIVKMNAAGYLDSNFGSSGIVDVAMTNLALQSAVRIALAPDNTVVVAGSKTDRTMAVKRFGLTGSADSSFNAGSEYAFGTTSSGMTSVSNIVTDLVVLDTGKIIISAYEDDSSSNTTTDRLVLARITRSGTLDTDFNTSGLYEFVATDGQYDSRLMSFDIQADGNIIAVGYDKNPGSTIRPIMVRALGDDFVTAVPKYPGAGFIGTLDVTFGTVNDGKMPVYFGINHGIAQYAAGVYAYSDQKPLLYGYGYSDTDTTYKHVLSSRFLIDGSLDATYGGGAGTIPGAIVSSLVSANSEVVNHILVDQFNKILVAGYIASSPTQGYIRRYSSSGVLDTSFGTAGTAKYTTGTSGSQVKAIALQGQDAKIILAGMNSGSGFLARYFTAGAIDTSFGNSVGSYTKLETVHSAVVGASDIIYVAQTTSDNKLQIVAVKKDGKGLVTTFGSNGQLTVATGISSTNGVWIALDANGRLVIAASINDGTKSYIMVKRYTTAGSLNASFNADGSVWSTVPTTTITALSRVLVATNNKIVLVGYENNIGADTDYLLAVRLNASLSLDTGFGEASDGFFRSRVYTPGGIDSQFVDGYITSSGKILLAGHEVPAEGGSTPVVMRINGDANVGQVTQYPSYYPGPHNISPMSQVAGSIGSATVQQQSADVSVGMQSAASHQFASSNPTGGSNAFAANPTGWNSGGGATSGGWRSYGSVTKGLVRQAAIEMQKKSAGSVGSKEPAVGWQSPAAAKKTGAAGSVGGKSSARGS